MRFQVLVLSSLISLQAQASTVQFCWSVIAPVDTLECRELKTPVKISKRLAEVCNRYQKENDRRRCIGYTANKIYKPSEVDHCVHGWYIGNMMSCLKNRGQTVQ